MCAAVFFGLHCVSQPMSRLGISVCYADSVGNEGDDWQAFQAQERFINDSGETDARKQAEMWLAFFKQRSAMHPNLGCATLSRAGDLLRDGAKDPKAAIETYDLGLQKYKDQPASAILLEGKVRTLVDTGRADEAVAALKPQIEFLFKAVEGGHPHHILMSSLSLRQLVIAQQDDKNGEAGTKESIALLQRILWQLPVYLFEHQQGAGTWENGWMYDRLIDALIKSGKNEEALSWAKLYYATCAFDEESIGRATRALGRAWAANDDFGASSRFAKAQAATPEGNAAPKNPLTEVPLPTPAVDLLPKVEAAEKTLQNALRVGQDQDGRTSRALINVYLSRGDAASLKLAITTAKNLLKTMPDRPEGAQEICRIFKAHDLNTVRANAFIAYLGGEGKNPLLDLNRELEAAIPPVQ